MTRRKAFWYILGLVLGFSACRNSPEQSEADVASEQRHLLEGAVCISDGIPARPLQTNQTNPVITNMGSDNSKMVWIPGGTFQMGSEQFPDSQPVHQVSVEGFWIDEHEVTNAQFALFVEATGYQTVAERALDPKDFPTVPLDMLVPGSAVFTPPSATVNLNDFLQWWSYVPGANWRHPEGPGSDIKDKMNHPVVQISYEDALAYATWAGKRLPTEAEWEYAARAGRGNTLYYWGDKITPEGKWVANVYQGDFPVRNSADDGYVSTAPVKSFPANPFGLYDMDGNVWEWCADFYRPDYYQNSPERNPQGPDESMDPVEPELIKRVQRGGSFLCNDQYCERYIAGSRGKGEVSSASNNLGFRCVSDNPPPEI